MVWNPPVAALEPEFCPDCGDYANPRTHRGGIEGCHGSGCDESARQGYRRCMARFPEVA